MVTSIDLILRYVLMPPQFFVRAWSRNGTISLLVAPFAGIFSVRC